MSILASAERAYNDACELRDQAFQALEALGESGDGDPGDETGTDAAFAVFDEAQAGVERSKAELDRVKAVMEARDNTPLIAITTTAATASTSANTWGGGNSSSTVTFAAARGQSKPEQTYRPDNGSTFFRDLYRATTKGDTEARDRIAKHALEMRDLTTVATDGGGFVPPLYMGDLWAEKANPDRPFANALGALPLPDKGMTITIPRVTTSPAAAVQATENTALNETELVEATLSVPVRTIGGIEDVSVQLLDRSDPGIDRIIAFQLRSSYDSVLDAQLIAGSGASGQHLGISGVGSIQTVTYTDASPTAAELVPKIYDGIQKVASNRYRNPGMILMHPRRAAWLASNLSSTFPLFQQGSLYQASGTQDNGFIGTFAGLNVILDANIATNLGAGTNEDRIYILYSADLLLWEDAVRFETFTETLSAEATVRFRLFAYSAFASGRQPNSICEISGTGLVTPTF